MPPETAACERPQHAQTPRALLAACEIASRWEERQDSISADRIVNTEIRSRRYLGSRERREVAELVFGYIRAKRRLEAVLASLGLPTLAENGVRLLAREQGYPDALDITDEQMRSAVSALPNESNAVEYIAKVLSFPDDWAHSLVGILGDTDAISAAQALNSRAPTTLRVNTLATTPDYVLKLIEGAQASRWSPLGVQLTSQGNIFDLPHFRDGWFEAQEEASQLTVLLADPHPGDIVVEIGAGAGGKSLALAAHMLNTGAIYAIDSSPARLEELKRRAAKAGVTCVKPLAVSSDSFGTWTPTRSVQHTLSGLMSRADVVLLDAPCTGSGACRRRPDARWRSLTPAGFTTLQSKLLLQGAMFTAPGGHLVYSTCSFDREQNEEIIEAFLETDFGKLFSVEPAIPRIQAAAAWAATCRPGLKARREQELTAPEQIEFETLSAEQHMRTWPHVHGMDAHFAACLRRER